MENDTTKPAADSSQCGHASNPGLMSGAYFLAFIGAAIYYIQHSTTFWMGVVGFLKAMVWPAFLVYKLLEFLKM